MGPPMTNLPVALIDGDVLELAGVVHVLGQDRLDDVLDEVGVDDALQVGALGVLRGEHDLDDLDRLAVLVPHGDLGLAVGPQVRQDLGLAHVGQALGELVRQRDGQRHELGGLGAGVAEHHALVAGALRVEDVVVVDVGAHLEGRASTPWLMSGDCSSMATMTPQVS